MPQEYIKARPIINKLEQAGFEAYFVGGSVRDILLHQKIHDVDIATSAFPAEVKAIFPKTIDIGIEHGTVLVLSEGEQYEITTFRTESTYQDFRRPDDVQFVRSLEEDLKRRDFTINALALNKKGTVIDLFNGLTDLQNKILRAVGDPHERFHEDALRMMRGLRFVSQLGFELEPTTFEAIKENHNLLEKISVERITIEFVKLLLGEFRNLGLEMLLASQCYQYCPGLAGYLKELEKFAELKGPRIKEETQAWVLLLDTLQISPKQVRSFLKAWKCSNERICTVQAVLSGLQERKEGFFQPKTLYDLGLKQALLVEELLPYYQKTSQLERVEKKYEALPIKNLSQLAINGNDLLQFFQQKPGSWIKSSLEACEKKVLERQLPNQKQDLLSYTQTLLSKS